MCIFGYRPILSYLEVNITLKRITFFFCSFRRCAWIFDTLQNKKVMTKSLSQCTDFSPIFLDPILVNLR